MKEFKGTPGPFIVKDILPSRLSIVIGEGLKEQAIASIYGNGNEPEILANCKLLCASKKMLEALQAIIDYWQNAEEWDPSLELINQVDAALSAALD